jgi:hypothetical protein
MSLSLLTESEVNKKVTQEELAYYGINQDGTLISHSRNGKSAMTWEDVKNSIEQATESKCDIILSESLVRLNEDHWAGRVGIRFTGNAIRQLAGLAKVPSAVPSYQMEHGYLDDMSRYINAGMNVREVEKTLGKRPSPRMAMVRMIQIDSQWIVRAVLSGTYTRIDNHHVAGMIDDYVKDCKVDSHYVTGDSMAVDFLSSYSLEVDGEHFELGFSVSTDEVGGGAFRIEPWIQTDSGIVRIPGGKDIQLRKTHRGAIDEVKMKRDIERVIHSAITAGQSLSASIQAAKNHIIKNQAEFLCSLSREPNMTHDMIFAIAKIWKAHKLSTGFHLVKGISMTAANLPVKDSVNLQRVAGHILGAEKDADKAEKRWKDMDGLASRRVNEKLMEKVQEVLAL